MAEKRKRSLSSFWEVIKSDAKLLSRALVNPKVGILAKILIVILVLYILSPIDIIPDRILGLGYIDDIGVALLLVSIVKRMIPQTLQEEILKRVIVRKK